MSKTRRAFKRRMDVSFMDIPSEDRLGRLVDRVQEHAPKENVRLGNAIAALREEIRQAQSKDEETQALMAKYEEAYQKLTSPANRVGVFLRHMDDGNVGVLSGDTEYVALVDPAVNLDNLKPGTRVRLNEAFAVVGVVPESSIGPLIKVSDVLADGRLRVGADQFGGQGRLIERIEALNEAPIKVGDEVRTDLASRIAVEHFQKATTNEYFIEEVPQTPWSDVGGQQAAIKLIRETIEQPLLYPELYDRFDKKPVKGILLYGPPGCGKTLIGKAVAYNLAKEYSERTGKDVKECFMHISGPKVLNMWLGETERMVREIFTTAREKAKEGQLVVVFIDEAESILRTRSGGRYLNISNTVVPQFCAEMDGLVALENVVLIITSNRPDYIDPAILRPERIDRKIKIVRPDRDASRQILSIYLHERLPIDAELLKHNDNEPDCARRELVEGALEALWSNKKESEFLRVHMKSGSSETLHWKDLVSGALLKSVVDRAKDTAMQRAISEPKAHHGLRVEDLVEAVKQEFKENEIFPKSDAAEDWLKLLDFDPESVVGVSPVVATAGDKHVRKNII